MHIQVLKENLEHLTDPRRTSHGNIRHKLEDIVIIGLCTVICGGVDFIDMQDMGKEREAYFREFLELPNGIPDSDTFRRVFERINPKELSKCLTSWLEVEREKRSVVAIDGKTIRGSGNDEHKAYHVVSAFVSENQITLGELVVPEKTNEITAVPELLDLIDIEGAIVTADAMSCQKVIVEKIRKKKADYVIGLKRNQSSLYDDVNLFFSEFKDEFSKHETLEKDHGRIEQREYRLCTEISWLNDVDKWKGLAAVGMVKSVVLRNGRETSDTRYFITSLSDLAEFSYAVRKHWSIENQLHWCLDVVFREDASRARKDNSPLNMNILRKVSIPLLNAAKYGRLSKKRMMFKAALNPEVFLDILFQRKK